MAVVQISTTRTTVQVTTTQFPGVPFDYPEFLVPSGVNGGSCSGDFSDAIVFGCPKAITQGCTVNVDEPIVGSFGGNHTVIASPVPKIGLAGEPTWANCSYETYLRHNPPRTPSSPLGSFFGYCIPIDSTCFIISEPGRAPCRRLSIGSID